MTFKRMECLASGTFTQIILLCRLKDNNKVPVGQEDKCSIGRDLFNVTSQSVSRITLCNCAQYVPEKIFSETFSTGNVACISFFFSLILLYSSIYFIIFCF